MDTKAANKHLQRVGGLTVQTPNQAQHPGRAYRHNDGPGLLAVTSGLCSPYRLTSIFGISRGSWQINQIRFVMAVADACRDAAFNHPLYHKNMEV